MTFVYTITDEKVRLLIERYTAINCGPNRIEFVQDGNGNWIVGPEVLTDGRYTFQKVSKGETRETLRTKLQTETTRDQVTFVNGNINIAELIRQYGQLIEYVPIPENETPTETIRK